MLHVFETLKRHPFHFYTHTIERFKLRFVIHTHAKAAPSTYSTTKSQSPRDHLRSDVTPLSVPTKASPSPDLSPIVQRFLKFRPDKSLQSFHSTLISHAAIQSIYKYK